MNYNEITKVIRPSLLSSTFLCLRDDIDEMIRLGVKTIHYDVMDGSFVSDISFGEPVYASLKKYYRDAIDFEVHLMTYDGVRQARQFYALGARSISIHYEYCKDKLADVVSLKNLCPDLKLGIAINPDTDVDDISEFIHLADFVLVMSVVPGKGGQGFIPGSELKVKRLAEMREKYNLHYIIGVDGGINALTGSKCYKCGADYLVCGSSYFKAEDKLSFLKEMANIDE